MSERLLYEAYSVARAVEVACGATEEMEAVFEVLEEALDYPGRVEAEALEEAALLLRSAADRLRRRGCLEWYMLEQAADTLEHIY